MNFIFEKRPRVYDDIIEAVDYFFDINPKLAEDFLDRIEEAKIKILNSPKSFEIRLPDVRNVLLQQFDYHIYYLMEGQKIIILAILHAHSGEEKISKI